MMGFSPIVDGVESSVVSGGAMWNWLLGAGTTALAVLVVALLGLFAAKVLSGAVRRIARYTKIDTAFESLGWSKQLSDIGIDAKPSAVIAWLVKWFVIIAVFSGIINYLGVQQLSNFLNEILAYLPNVIVAVLIVVIGSLIANFVRKTVAGALEKADGVTNKKLASNIPYYAIMTITVLTAANHLGIGGNMIEILFTGIVVALSLGLGLAFGLGGKEHAARILDKLLRK